MAVKPFAASEIITRGDHGHIITWADLLAGDTGQILEMIGSNRRTVQVTGNFANGGKVVIEGSNDKVNWSTLSDIHGNALSFNNTGISTLADLTAFTRPRGVSGTVARKVSMLIRKDLR